MEIIHLARNGLPVGIYNATEIQEGLKVGRFLLSDYGWKIGMAQWKTLGEWPEFAPIFQPQVTVLIPGEPLVVEPAWERRAELGAWNAFWKTVRDVWFSPSKVFSSLSRDGNISGAFIFYLIAAMTMSIIAQIVSTASGFEKWINETVTKTLMEHMGMDYAEYAAQQAEQMANIPAGAQSMLQAVQIGGAIIGTIFGVLIGIFISAGIAHLLLMIVGGAKRPFAVTFKVVAYVLGAFAFLTWMPVLGFVIGLTFGSVVEIIGLARAHEISIGKAAFAVLLPVAAIICCLGVGAGTVHFMTPQLRQHIAPSMRGVPVHQSPVTPVSPESDDIRFVM